MRKLLITSLCILGFVTCGMGQQFSGVATYMTSSRVMLAMDSTKMPPGEMEAMRKELQRKLQREYTLSFTRGESTWKQIESLNDGPARASGSGMQIMIADNSANEILYKNISEQRYERGRDIMGKHFIVKDSLNNYNWKLTSETKMIGSYTCQKAVSTRIIDAKRFSTGMTEMETVKDTVTTVVWYTMDIPVSNGPDDYYGLPGLILEVNRGNQTIICTRVELNPAEGVEIKKPVKGQVVTEEEFRAINDEKMKEMMERYNGKDGNHIQITIDG